MPYRNRLNGRTSVFDIENEGSSPSSCRR